MQFSRESTWKILLALLIWATISIALPWRWCRSVYEIGLFALAGSICWRSRDEPSRLLNGILLLLGPAMAGVLQWMLGLTVSRLETAEAVAGWMATFSAAFVARHTLAHTSLRHQFLTAVAAIGGLVALVCLVQMPLRGVLFAGFTVPDFDLFAGPFQNRNTYASFAELMMPVAIWKAVTAKRGGAWVWWGVASVLAASVVATGSRAGSANGDTAWPGGHSRNTCNPLTDSGNTPSR